MEYRYSLRTALCPDYRTEENFLKLLNFCIEAGIDDVQFFINMEELNNGHLTLEEADTWLDMIASLMPRLRSAGIGVSLNPWHTTLHTDRGRTLKEGQNFVTMVDYEGNQAKAVACPLDPAFRTYLGQMYSKFAKLGFDIIWVEDDFRLHNHAPLEWGGCFCQAHMREFERHLGKKESRDEFVHNMTKPGLPTPERIAWLDTMKETMNGFAKLLGDAVHQVAPQTRVGLMSSAPQNHAIEGRQWNTVLERLSGATKPLNRLHMAPYTEVAGREYCLTFQRFSRLTAALLPDNTEKWPELENIPYTSFAKSDTFTKFQIETSLAVCADGISLNLFDQMGNGIGEQEHYNHLLSGLKPYLKGVTALGAKTAQEAGICVLVDPNTVYHTNCSGGTGPGALYPWQTFWAEYLSAFGIANYMAVKPRQGETVAVGGQVLRGMTAEEIRKLAANHRLLLDGESVEIMVEKGCGDLIHVEKVQWHLLNGGYHSYEQVRDDRPIHGFSTARMSAQALSETVESGDYLEIAYTDQVREHTCLRNWEGTCVGAGLTEVENVIVFPYGHFKAHYEAFLNPVRRELFSQLLDGAAQVLHGQFVTINHFPVALGHMILLSNFSTDDMDTPELKLPFDWTTCCQVSRVDGSLKEIPFTRTEHGFRLSDRLHALQTMCLIVR